MSEKALGSKREILREESKKGSKSDSNDNGRRKGTWGVEVDGER